MSRLTLLVALFGLAACGASPPRDAKTPPANILLVTIDTMRADRLGRGFTPTLDRLAAQGLRFTHTRSVVPLTLPAHVSIMTGELPPAHGIRLNGAARLNDRATLASRLKAAGYQTRAVVGAFVLDRRFGLDAGFDEYDDRIARDPNAMDQLQADRRANEVVDRAMALLERTASDRPWLLWAHLYDPHAPYDPPPAARAHALGDPYNGEIAFIDQEIARLLAAVNARPDAHRTATIVLGDHGESLGDHGEPTHGMLLFEPALRVPLIVTGPGILPAERADPSSLIDVLPTALALAGQAPIDVAGRSLLAPPASDREIYAETEYPTVAGWTPLRTLIQDRWKLVEGHHPALYDLASDPGEQENLARVRTPVVQAMSGRLDAIKGNPSLDSARDKKGLPPQATRTQAPVSAETAERLRSLGYVAPTSAPTSAPAAAAGGVNPVDAIETWASFEGALAGMNTGRVSQALPALARVAGAYPESPIFQSTYARALASGGRKREALARFRAAVKRWPADATMYHELAVVARDLGLAAEATRAEEASLALNSQEPAAHNGKGLVLVDAGRHAEAARSFEEAVRLDPTNAVYYANLGNARRALADLAAAATAYRRALDLAPQLADAANGLGVVLIQQKQPADAVRWLEQAARDPSFVEAQLNLAIALQEAGELERAKAQYRRVVSASGPHAKEREAARTLLSQLERR